MKLNEILGTPYKYMFVKTSHGEYGAEFTTAGGDEVEVVFQHWATPDIYEVYFDREGQIKLSGKGDALRIFSTVLAALEEFIKKAEPKALYFTAKSDEPSRVSLYKRLVKKFVQHSGFVDVTNDLEKVDNELIKAWFAYRTKKLAESHNLLVRKDLLKP